jgi:hypothetical protein
MEVQFMLLSFETVQILTGNGGRIQRVLILNREMKLRRKCKVEFMCFQAIKTALWNLDRKWWHHIVDINTI